MSLYGPTFLVTPVDLCIIFQCNLYISCIMSCGNKIVSKLFQIVSKFRETIVILSEILRAKQSEGERQEVGDTVRVRDRQWVRVRDRQWVTE